MFPSIATIIALSGALAAEPSYLEQPRFNEPPPSPGTGFIVTGGIVTASGAAYMLMAPVTRSAFANTGDGSFSGTDVGNLYFYTFLISGGVRILVGVPLLIYGIVLRGEHNDWRESQRKLADLPNIGGFATDGGGGVTFGMSF